ncbi:MAG: hypothetical protein AAF539_09575 [Planctomycetota bacterium]
MRCHTQEACLLVGLPSRISRDPQPKLPCQDAITILQSQTWSDPIVGVATNRPPTLEQSRVLMMQHPNTFTVAALSKRSSEDGLPPRQRHHIAMMQHQSACAKLTIVGAMRGISPSDAESLLGISKRSILCLDHSMVRGTDLAQWMPALIKADMVVLDPPTADLITAAVTRQVATRATNLTRLSKTTRTDIVVAHPDRLILHRHGRRTIARMGSGRSRLADQPASRGLFVAAIMSAMSIRGESAARSLFIAAALDADRGSLPTRPETMRRMSRDLQSRVIHADRRHRLHAIHIATAVSVAFIAISLIATWLVRTT